MNPINEIDTSTTQINIDFNEELLQGFLDQYGIKYSRFNEEEQKVIRILFAAYNVEYYKFSSLINEVTKNNKLDEKKFRLIVQKNYERSLKTNELDLVYKKDVKDIVADNTKLSKKIKLMSSKTPSAFLESRLKRKPAVEELKLIENIMSNYKIDSTTTNILMDFSLFRNNNRVVFEYIEKIAKTLKDKNYTNPVDIIAYLIEANNVSKSKLLGTKKSDNKNKRKPFAKEEVVEIKATQEEDKEVKELWEEFINEGR
jgi:replication initiation and membrane attachment protein DnaB